MRCSFSAWNKSAIAAKEGGGNTPHREGESDAFPAPVTATPKADGDENLVATCNHPISAQLNRPAKISRFSQPLSNEDASSDFFRRFSNIRVPSSTA